VYGEVTRAGGVALEDAEAAFGLVRYEILIRRVHTVNKKSRFCIKLCFD
jgi:hypothetical protein